MIPFTRDTAREHAMGKKIQRIDGSAEPIKVLGITDEGMYLGELEGGPFITYEWALANAVFVDGKPCGTDNVTEREIDDHLIWRHSARQRADHLDQLTDLKRARHNA